MARAPESLSDFLSVESAADWQRWVEKRLPVFIRTIRVETRKIDVWMTTSSRSNARVEITIKYIPTVGSNADGINVVIFIVWPPEDDERKR